MAILVGINFMPRFAHTFSYFTFDNFFEACRTDLRENIYLYVIRFEDTWVRFSAVYIYIYIHRYLWNVSHMHNAQTRTTCLSSSYFEKRNTHPGHNAFK